MTIGIALKVPGHGCVLACDSRVLAGHDIVTDSCDKFVVAGSAVALVAGHDGALMDRLSGARNFTELYETALEYTQDKPLNWDLLIYDRKSDTLALLDQHGTLLRLGLSYAIGCGSGYAIGVIDSSAKPKTLEAATKVAERAVRVAVKRSSACGGRIRVVQVPWARRKPVVVR